MRETAQQYDIHKVVCNGFISLKQAPQRAPGRLLPSHWNCASPPLRVSSCSRWPQLLLLCCLCCSLRCRCCPLSRHQVCWGRENRHCILSGSSHIHKPPPPEKKGRKQKNVSTGEHAMKWFPKVTDLLNCSTYFSFILFSPKTHALLLSTTSSKLIFFWEWFFHYKI